MSVIGYARVSTTEQNIEPQLEQLTAAGCDKVFQEKRSGADAARPELGTMLDYVRDGDTVVCCKIDRLARSTKHLLEIVEMLKVRGVALRILNINLDTSTATGEMMLTMLGAIGQFEREMMLERQRDGIVKAKEDGKYNGRKPTAMNQAAEVMELIRQGMTRQATADRLGISVASVYRVVRAEKKL